VKGEVNSVFNENFNSPSDLDVPLELGTQLLYIFTAHLCPNSLNARLTYLYYILTKEGEADMELLNSFGWKP
jgi:hypothetical protein